MSYKFTEEEEKAIASFVILDGDETVLDAIGEALIGLVYYSCDCDEEDEKVLKGLDAKFPQHRLYRGCLGTESYISDQLENDSRDIIGFVTVGPEEEIPCACNLVATSCSTLFLDHVANGQYY